MAPTGASGSYAVKLASYVSGDDESFGMVIDGRIVDLKRRTKAPDLRALLEAGELREISRFANDPADIALDSLTLLPPIPRPAHIFCVGTNYADHLKEVQDAGVPRARTKAPPLFIRYPETLVAHDADLICPAISNDFDFEGELAVIIGIAGRNISAYNALSHVAGYSCFNDGSIRDWQFHTAQITSGKNFTSTGSFGPFLLTADEIPDPGKLKLITSINGQVVQNGTTADMIFGVSEIISYVSTILELLPGDVIATGTPSGVGFSRKPPFFLRDGDRCVIEITRVGKLSNLVRKEERTG